MHKYPKLIIFIMMLLSLVVITSAQDDVTTPFEVYDDEPAISRGDFGEWDGRYTDPGAVIYHDGQFHMLRNGFNNWPARTGASYHTSDDGITWTQVSEGQVFETESVDFAEIAALASSLIVEDDGTWVLYFYAWNDRPGRADAATIGRATADTPLGEWRVDPEPVLLNGGEGEWDESQLTAPSVIRTEDGYVMYFSGTDSATQQAIGMATSDDGINWTKYDDPSTTEAPYAESDPVMIAELDWEGSGIHQSHVMSTDDGYVMIYRGTGTGNNTMRLGVATSTDGLIWERQESPIFAPYNVEGGVNFWFHNALYHDGTYYLYVEIGPDNSPSQTNIYATTYDGTFFGD